MINVKINSQSFSFARNSNLAQAIKRYGLTESVYAVAINGYIVPKALHLGTLLEENMVIDIIVPMQGG